LPRALGSHSPALNAERADGRRGGADQLDPLDASVAWALLACRKHCIDGFLRAGEQRFHLAAFGIPHPAGKAERIRALLRPRAKADALNVPGDADSNGTDRRHALPYVPSGITQIP
jgi:hypothetical protein